MCEVTIEAVFQPQSIVFKVNCLDCVFTYYSQMDRAITTRLSEHRRADRVCDSNSKLAQPANQFGHNMDFDYTIIVDKAADYHKRLFLEAWHSKRDQNAGNEHIEIPDIYVSIMHNIPRFTHRSHVLAVVTHISINYMNC